ncbi:MAG: DNA polymerase [Porticoccaceae bacterium]|nr:DNA polymerase [Porticoccaceae bacterium]OUW58414.1 MAG: hypothetical protein CBD57_02550 [Candidatus Pelagibacter sp. TMED197]|tara:strand:+ start:7559 stop:7975 length:417 start_codon:yes stop_codon:yes gene_type:complete
MKKKYNEIYSLSKYLNAINYTKEPLLENKEDPFWEKKYPAFVVNRCLSYHKELIYIVNEMNQRANISNRLQFHFFINSIRRMRRFGSKWATTNRSKAFDAIKKYYGYSNEKARVALDILSKEQQGTIIKKVSVGGKHE